MKRLYTILFLLTAFTVSSCDYLPLRNVCADEKSMEDVKLQTAFSVWVMENPEEAVLTSLAAGLSGIFGGTEKLEGELAEKVRPIMESLKLEDVSKPQKLSEDQYRCSAVFSYKEKRLATVYNITLIHSGKEKFYKVEVQDVDWMK